MAKSLSVTFQRLEESEDNLVWGPFCIYAPGRKLTPGHTMRACYRYLLKAGLPELEPGEKVTVKVQIKRLRRGRPKARKAATVGA